MVGRNLIAANFFSKSRKKTHGRCVIWVKTVNILGRRYSLNNVSLIDMLGQGKLNKNSVNRLISIKLRNTNIKLIYHVIIVS